MHASLVIWAAIALAIFWGVGAYKRLMRMRESARAAMGSFEKHTGHCLDLIDAQSQWASEHSPAAQFVQLGAELRRLLALDKSPLLDTQHMAQVGATWTALVEYWDAWSARPSDLAGEAIPLVLQTQWQERAVRVELARSGLNKILEKYNDALQQFPVRLICGIMGFEPASTL